MVKCILEIRGDQAECLVVNEKKDNDRELLRALFTGGQYPADLWSFMEVMPCMKTCSPMMYGAKNAQSSSIAMFIS